LTERREEVRRLIRDRRVEIDIPYQVSVTGPILVVHGQDHYIADAIEELPLHVTEFTTGAAFGVDTLAARIAVVRLPDTVHRIVAPAKLHNDELAPALIRDYGSNRRIELVQMPEGSSYLDRNEYMVDLCDVLLAFPDTEREMLRSGTWHTVRAARRKGKVIKFFPLNGDEPWTEVPEPCSLDLQLVAYEPERKGSVSGD
jgi:hypothetical protein